MTGENKVLIFTEMNNTQMYHDGDAHQNTLRGTRGHNSS
jgi:hypothetical protein